MRGRKPLPTNVHLLRGTASKLPPAELAARGVNPPVSVPTCPKHLSTEARTEWNRIVAHLEKLGLISDVYRANLAVYCQAYGRWVQAERKIKELGAAYGLVETTPSGYKQMSCWLQISNRAAQQIREFGSEFGMTPSSITRVTQCAQMDLFEDDPAAKYFS